jgi:hypothetical protein
LAPFPREPKRTVLRAYFLGRLPPFFVFPTDSKSFGPIHRFPEKSGPRAEDFLKNIDPAAGDFEIFNC